jgi:hypothetical protein
MNRDPCFRRLPCRCSSRHLISYVTIGKATEPVNEYDTILEDDGRRRGKPVGLGTGLKRYIEVLAARGQTQTWPRARAAAQPPTIAGAQAGPTAANDAAPG